MTIEQYWKNKLWLIGEKLRLYKRDDQEYDLRNISKAAECALKQHIR